MVTRWELVYVLTLLISSARQVLSAFHLPKFGGCPDLKAQQQFITNIEKFVDSPWFVQSSFDTEVLQGKGRCMTASYKWNPFSQSVVVSTAQINEENNNWERLDANAIPENVDKDEAKFKVEFTVPIFGKVGGLYTILGTDYATYSVIHGCGSFLGILHYDCSWLMSRKQVLSSDEEQKFYNSTSTVLANYESLDPAKFSKVDQTKCQE